MAGDPANVHVWETGDLYVYDPDTPFVAGTAIPADIDTDLPAGWQPAGLMLGDPGMEMTRDIDENELNAWQIKRFRVTWKNGKLNGGCTLYEDNDVMDDLIDPEGVPAQKARYLAMVFWDSMTGHTERRFTKARADIFVENDSQSEDPKGRPLRIRYYPDSTSKIFTIQKGVPATP